MSIGAEGLALIKRSEGLRLKAYPDPASGGDPWTIGYGTTEGVYPGLVIDEAEAERRLLKAVAEFKAMVVAGCPGISNENQLAALVSFAFNLGPGARGVKDGFMTLRNGNVPTIRRLYNAGNWRAASDEFPKWANPPLPGLVVRRARERNLFLGRDWRAIPDGNEPNALSIARAHNAVPA